MGRGTSKVGGRTKSPPAYISETEKAVKLTIIVEDFTLGDQKRRDVWVPKSQLAEDGRPSEWITRKKAEEFYTSIDASYSNYEARWKDGKGDIFEPSMTKREKEYAKERQKREKQRAKKRQKAYEEGVKEYNALIARAKELGVKGVRVGLKKQTILRKINEAQQNK